ncbi:putative ABC transporter permease [Peptoniphilus sp.]|jgi:uncharacterized membrane protein|uniref:putative ABC transporter permease n=1 Tax=Peptoniphilus sp. TaxID=1971214 RepID=UPI003D8E953E
MNIVYFYTLVLIFFIYSILGWITEVILKYFQYNRFINRGFLIGPYCPIYGTGAVAVTVLSNLLKDYDSSYGTVFLISFFACGLIEYIVGYVLEKRFHARWWDYSYKPMNIHGRVWIGNLILFGIGGVFIVKIFNPHILSYIDTISISAMKAISITIIIVMASDYIVSHFIIALLKEGVESSKQDKSEEIAKEVRFLLENKSVFHKRIIDAYPELVFRTERVKERIEKIKEESEYIREMANKKIEEISDIMEERHETLSKNLVTTRNLQKSIIEIQDEIIKNLTVDGNLNEENKELFDKLEEKKKILEQRELLLKKAKEDLGAY